EPLLRLLQNDPSAEVRAEAAFALGYFKKYNIDIEPLVLALEDKHHLVKQNAAFALGKIARRKSVKPLIVALESNENANVREMVAWALGEIRDKRATHSLIQALTDSRLSVRKNAAYALGRLQDISAIEPLRKRLLFEGESKEVAWALSCLMKKRPTIALLKDAFRKTRRADLLVDSIEICRVLFEIDKKSAKALIKDMLSDNRYSLYVDELKSIY
ncbi:MAG: HEAT repeat domain-containing protein, partial [Candidatus Heimdallarchaeota archaeon]